jgi:hypothetical protein
MVSYSERGNRTVRLHDSFLNDQDPRLLLYLKSCRFMRFSRGSRLRPLRGWEIGAGSTKGELRKCHRKPLIMASKMYNAEVPTITIDAATKRFPGQVLNPILSRKIG